MVTDPLKERKARAPTVVRALELSKLTVERYEQDLKASTPIVVKLLGSEMLFRGVE